MCSRRGSTPRRRSRPLRNSRVRAVPRAARVRSRSTRSVSNLSFADAAGAGGIQAKGASSLAAKRTDSRGSILSSRPLRRRGSAEGGDDRPSRGDRSIFEASPLQCFVSLARSLDPLPLAVTPRSATKRTLPRRMPTFCATLEAARRRRLRRRPKRRRSTSPRRIVDTPGPPQSSARKTMALTTDSSSR